MTLTKALMEGTYTIQPIADEIYVKEIKPFIINARKDKMTIPKAVDITGYLKKAVEDKFEIKFPLFLKISIAKSIANPESSAGAWVILEKEKNKITIILRIPRNRLSGMPLKELKNTIMSPLIHELVHAIDFNRAEKISVGIEDTSKKINIYDYLYKDEFEFNAVIHQIIKESSTHRGMWNKITNMVKFMSFCREYVPLLWNSLTELNTQQNKNLFNKIIKRLARENLLPPRFTGKLMR